MVEESRTIPSFSPPLLPEEAHPEALCDVPEEGGGTRLSTGLAEFDRVLGGGAYAGSVILLGGEPGIGKSTLILQAAMNMAAEGIPVLYATGEESASQVAGRAGRIGASPRGLAILPASRLDTVSNHSESGNYRVLVVDSVQTLYSPGLQSAPGSVSQVRHCASSLVALAKPRGITAFVVGHVTKDGNLAGPKVLEHLVDTVVYFEGDASCQYRLLRAVKNRFGGTNELGVFEMGSRGLSGVANASGLFLRRESDTVPGSVPAAVLQGSRPFLVEVQALTSPSRYGYPQRKASGFDGARLSMLLAVLGRRCGIDLDNHDVYVNVAGGFILGDPGADLAVCLAVASSHLGRPAKNGVAVCGEVGLGGEVRPVAGYARRYAEAVNLGFSTLAGAREDTEAEGNRAPGFVRLSAAMTDLLDEKGEECF
jgi:DNA repair protein RadA/Sms